MSGVKRQKFKTIQFRANNKAQEKILSDISLNLAVKLNDFEAVESLIEKGADINKPGKNKLTPLHVAVNHNRIIILHTLVQKGAFVDALSIGPKSQRCTPLHLAIEQDRSSCAKILLKNGANISGKKNGIYSPIYYAVIKGNIKMVSLLLDHGVDVNLRFDNDFFEENKPTFHRSLWQDHNLPLLHYSILQKNCELTEVLLDHGADVNLRTCSGKTTLMQAVEVCDIFLVANLVDKKNVNDRDNFGQPVMHFTVLNANRKTSMYSKEESKIEYRTISIVDSLLLKGADLYARFPEDQEHSTVIHYMIQFGFKFSISRLLYSYSKDLNFNIIDLKSVYLGRLVAENLTPDIENDLDYINNLKLRFEDITYDIVKKAMILKMAGLPVDENLLLMHPIHDWVTPQKYTSKICLFRKNIEKQIDFMKGIKLGDSNFTLWHLVSCKMNELIKLMSIKAIRNYSCNETQIPSMSYYHTILENRLSHAFNRKYLLESSTEIIFNLFINCLPYDCCEQIVMYLNNQDLILISPVLKLMKYK